MPMTSFNEIQPHRTQRTQRKEANMDMNRIREFLSRTGLGMFLVWGCAAVLFLVVKVGSSFWGKAGVAVDVAATVVFAGTHLWYVLVFFVTLAKRQWKKSAIMFVLGGVGQRLLAVGLGFAMALNFRPAAENWEKGKEKPRLVGVSGEDGKTAFSVEYVNAHPFLAEYDKTIVFKSDDGKDPYVGIIEPKWTAVDAGAANLPFTLEWRDNKNRWSRQWRIATVSGKHFGLAFAGEGEFETCFVYVGAPGVYRLHFVSKNGRMSDMFDNEYRIDANSEKVEMIVGGFLLRIPPGTIDILSFGMNGNHAHLTAVSENGTQIESDVCIPASEDGYQYMLVGSISYDGSFRQCR